LTRLSFSSVVDQLSFERSPHWQLRVLEDVLMTFPSWWSVTTQSIAVMEIVSSIPLVHIFSLNSKNFKPGKALLPIDFSEFKA
jgi:hypothetical protein